MKTLVDEYIKEKYQPQSILYHYTSTEVMLSIIKNKSLWLSDISKANDTRELSWVLSSFMNVFPNVFKKTIHELNLEKVINADIFLAQIRDHIRFNTAMQNIKNKHFICCFSEMDDLLSQWRGYGNDGNGVAIGFDSNLLMKFENNTTFEFAKIIYSEEKLKQFLHSVLNDQLKMFNYSESDLYNYRTEIGMLIQFIANEGFIFKNPYFSEEKEWRLICKATSLNFDFDDGIEDYTDDGLTTSFYNEKKGPQFSRSEIKFRSIINDIISHVELGFAPVCSNFIRRIVLGPKCKINEFDLKLLLHCNGYLNSIEDDSIEITRSKIPYI